MTNPPMVYIQSDIPDGMTLAAWRASRSAPKRRFGMRVRTGRLN